MIPHPGEPGDETWAGSPFESRWMSGVWGQRPVLAPRASVALFFAATTASSQQPDDGTIVIAVPDQMRGTDATSDLHRGLRTVTLFAASGVQAYYTY